MCRLNGRGQYTTFADPAFRAQSGFDRFNLWSSIFILMSGSIFYDFSYVHIVVKCRARKSGFSSITALSQSNGSASMRMPENLVHTPTYLIKLWANFQA